MSRMSFMPHRRWLVVGALFVLNGVGHSQNQNAPADLLLRGGRVLDGTGNPWMLADIAIRNGRIVAMGRLGTIAARREIDVSGLMVAPGFIDVHSHAGPGLAGALNHAEPLLAQGITTACLNPDGGGPIDVSAQRTSLERRRTAVNTALFIGHGSIRERVIGMADRAPSNPELEQMAALVRAAMKAGAVGLSSGLYYAPGSYARTEEVIALAKVAGEAGGVYSSHIRDEGDYNIGVVAAVDEVIRIADEARLPGIVSHMKALGQASWGLSFAMTTRVELARARGVQVFADQYPYEAGSTSLVGALVPRWAEAGGRTELVKRLTGPDRPRLLDEVARNIARRGGPSTLFISRFEADPSIEGKSLADVAATRARPAAEVVLDLLGLEDATLVSFTMHERDIVQIMTQPYTMTCTDGDLVPMGEGRPHPRVYGAFARKLRVYVRERGILDWSAAVRSMTSLPAAVFGLKDRGVLRPGAWADVLVFDADRISDRANYQEPHRLSEGIVHILVNGELVRENERFTGTMPGRVLVPERQ